MEEPCNHYSWHLSSTIQAATPAGAPLALISGTLDSRAISGSSPYSSARTLGRDATASKSRNSTSPASLDVVVDDPGKAAEFLPDPLGLPDEHFEDAVLHALR